MSAMGTLERLARALALGLAPLETRLSPDEVEQTLLELGLASPPGLFESAALVTALATGLSSSC